MEMLGISLSRKLVKLVHCQISRLKKNFKANFFSLKRRCEAASICGNIRNKNMKVMAIILSASENIIFVK